MALAQLAREGWNCSAVRTCALCQLFLALALLTTPGYAVALHVKFDGYRVKLWERMAANVRAAQQLELAVLLSELFEELEAAALAADARPTPPSSVSLGMHGDPVSARGSWRGQIELWRAYAATHGMPFVLDTEVYFDGEVFAEFLGLYWCAESAAQRGFHFRRLFLQPYDGRKNIPAASFVWASARDPVLLQGLAVFSQPPQYWDSLEALGAVLLGNAWTVWVDYDLTISPCCFDVFSFVELIDGIEGQDAIGGGQPHVILRDSPSEDYHHHCANAGFLFVRNSAIGRLFVDLARRKRLWPNLPYGYQGALAESLLELLGFEIAVSTRSKKSAYDSKCLPAMVLGNQMGQSSYANYCLCWRAELKRMAGPEHGRTSRWVRFLSTRDGPEVGLLLASLFIYRGGVDPQRARAAGDIRPVGVRGWTRGVGVLPLKGWSRDRHRAYADAWLPPDDDLGGPCALLPLIVHWASLPWRPRLIYEFLNARFPDELPLALLANGSAVELASAYRAAGARGRAAWRRFLELPAARRAIDWAGGGLSRLGEAACNLGSSRMWVAGGFGRKGRSTSPYGPHTDKR